MIRNLLLCLLLAFSPVAAPAQSPEIDARAGELRGLFAGTADLDALFAPAFLAAVPRGQIEAIVRQFTAQHGPVAGIERIEPRGPHEAVVLLGLERAVLRLNLSLEPQPPHRIAGLLVTGVEPRGDSLAAVAAEIAALPGETGFVVARLDAPAQPLAGHRGDRPLAIGSAFKLIVLAEIDRQVQAGARRWSDVATLDRRSLPSGLMQDWPVGSPATLHTLAALMISRSDNSATDLLLHAAGRDNVEAMMGRIGIAAAARNRPFLSTAEAFALKAGPANLAAAWAAGDEAARRRLLAGEVAAVPLGSLDLARFVGNPLHIDTVEWFASAEDLVRVMDWFRDRASPEARAILAISPGPGARRAEGDGYIGFKGGSESGVVSLSWLIRSQSGAWHAVAGTWNDPAAPVDNDRFVALMARAVQLVS